MANIPADGLQTDAEGIVRCWWCGTHEDYRNYHDHEWGRRVSDDVRLYEKLVLEGFQCGLSWLTVLRKRATFREVFAGFDFQQIARFEQADVDRLMQNPGIIRHRGKIESAINNATRAQELVDEYGSLVEYFERFRPDYHPPLESAADIVSQTSESAAMSKDLRKRGWSFVGPTTCYAFMQSVGLVNDHFVQCHCWDACQA